MRQNVFTLFASTTLTGTTVVKSAQTPLDQAWGFCVQSQATTVLPAGSYLIQGSCAPKDFIGTIPDVQWFNIGTAITVSAAGSVGTNIPDIGYQWMRVVFTPASGTGIISFVVSIKGV